MITWPTNTKEIIDEIRGTIGREIEIFTKEELGQCTSCTLDTKTNKSIDPFCSTCSGTGYIYTISGTTVSAHVNWGYLDRGIFFATGKIRDGDCKATIEYTENNLDLIDRSIKFIVDDKDLYLIEYDLKGVKEINRIACFLKQDPRNG